MPLPAGTEPDDPLDGAPGDGIAVALGPGGALLVTAASALDELSERSVPPAGTAGVGVYVPVSAKVAVGAVFVGTVLFPDDARALPGAGMMTWGP